MFSSGENLHLPKNLWWQNFRSLKQKLYDSCKVTQGSNFEFDLNFFKTLTNAFLLT